MINIENSWNFYLNRILLLAVGLWPFYQTKLARFQVIFFLSIVTSFIIFQLTAFMTNDCTSDLVIKVISTTLYYAVFVLKYSSFWVNISTVKSLMMQLQHIYNELKDQNEITIIDKYGYEARRYVAKIILITVCSLFVLIVQPFLSYNLSILVFNESQSHRSLIIVTEYFVDQEKYFYLILLHMNAATSIGSIALIATGMMLIIYVKYVCGMFRIASYRIEQAIPINMKEISLEDEIIICRRIIYAVNIHRKAIEFCEFIVSGFEGSFFLLVLFGVAALSISLFRILQLISFGNNNNIGEFLLYFISTNAIILYMFLANYAGQEITDHNNHVFSAAYNIQWYVTPPHIQRLILFLLQRSSKSYVLNIGGIFIASLECFATLVSTSVSYFTVLYSTQ